MGRPIVSVIIPAYNSEEFIEQAIASVLKQKVSLEIIAINDCSKDKTEEKIITLQQKVNTTYKDKTIKYLKNTENLGVATSRNRAVAMAQGRYVAFLDSDDWWEEDKLSLQLSLMEERKAVLCSTGRELVTHEGEATGKIIPVKEEITYKELLKHNSINCSSVLLRADIAKKHPMGNDEIHEDYILWLKLLKEYGRAVAVNKPLLKYRLSKGGKSRNKLKSARMTYKVYRYMGFGTLEAMKYFASYMAHGVVKYL